MPINPIRTAVPFWKRNCSEFVGRFPKTGLQFLPVSPYKTVEGGFREDIYLIESLSDNVLLSCVIISTLRVVRRKREALENDRIPVRSLRSLQYCQCYSQSVPFCRYLVKSEICLNIVQVMSLSRPDRDAWSMVK